MSLPLTTNLIGKSNATSFWNTTNLTTAYNQFDWKVQCYELHGVMGLSGPMLRASGIQWDLHKVDPYESYDQFDWKVQWQKEGDLLARYLVRVGEMRESIKIIKQAVEKIRRGPYENLEVRRFKKEKNSEWNDFEYKFLGKKPSPNFELSRQELQVRVEAPKGQLGIYLVGDGKSIHPGLLICKFFLS